MVSTSGDGGSGIGDIAILLIGCHCTYDELSGHFPFIFLPHVCIFIVIGRIIGARGNLVVGGIIGVIFLLPLP